MQGKGVFTRSVTRRITGLSPVLLHSHANRATAEIALAREAGYSDRASTESRKKISTTTAGDVDVIGSELF